MNYVMNDISIGILSIFYGLPYDIPNFDQKPIEILKKDLNKYEGVYESKALPLKLTMKVNKGQLTAQATGQGALNLTAYSTSEFRFEPAGIVIKFKTGENKVEYSTFVLKQGGGNFKFTRE